MAELPWLVGGRSPRLGLSGGQPVGHQLVGIPGLRPADGGAGSRRGLDDCPARRNPGWSVAAVLVIPALLVSYRRLSALPRGPPKPSIRVSSRRDWRTPLTSYLLIHGLPLLAAVALLAATLAPGLAAATGGLDERYGAPVPAIDQWLLAAVGGGILLAALLPWAAGFADGGIFDRSANAVRLGVGGNAGLRRRIPNPPAGC